MILEARKNSEYKKTKKKRKKEKNNEVAIQGKKSVLKNPGHL